MTDVLYWTLENNKVIATDVHTTYDVTDIETTYNI